MRHLFSPLHAHPNSIICVTNRCYERKSFKMFIWVVGVSSFQTKHYLIITRLQKCSDLSIKDYPRRFLLLKLYQNIILSARLLFCKWISFSSCYPRSNNEKNFVFVVDWASSSQLTLLVFVFRLRPGPKRKPHKTLLSEHTSERIKFILLNKSQQNTRIWSEKRERIKRLD